MADRRAALKGSDPLAKRLRLDELTASMLPEQSSALVPAEDGTLTLGHFKLSHVGLQVIGDITQDEWKAAGAVFRTASSALNWWIGDWINAVPARWGEMYDDAERITGLKSGTLRNVASIARSVDLSLRNDKLTWNHHVAVAALTPEEQRHWLDRSLNEKISAKRLARLIEEEPDPDPIPLLNRTFRRSFGRLWKGIKTGDPAKVSREDIITLRAWLDDIEEALNSAGKDRAT